jgi:hypothetical protein
MILHKSTLSVSVILFFIFKPEVYAQEKLAIGVSTQMLNTRLMTNLYNLNTKGAYRPTTTLFVEYNFGKKYCIHAGLGYTMMTQNSDAFKNNFNYLTMPLYFKIGRLKEDKRIAFTTFYGFNLHYLNSAQHIFLDETRMDIMDQSRKFHADLAFGGGLKFKLSDKITFETLTTFSIGTFINKPNAADMCINNLNTGFMLNLSYKFK